MSFFDELNQLANNTDPRPYYFSDPKRIVSGKIANELCTKYGVRMIKTLNSNMKHYGLVYKENDTIIDPKPFQVQYTDSPGGLYACSDLQLYAQCWKRTWVTSVTFPDDAQVSFEEFDNDKQPKIVKSTALTLGLKVRIKDHPIWQNLSHIQRALHLLRHDIVFYQQLTDDERTIVNYSQPCIDTMKEFEITIPFNESLHIHNLVVDYENELDAGNSVIINKLVDPDNDIRLLIFLISCICGNTAGFYSVKNRARLLPDNIIEFQEKHPQYNLILQWVIHGWKTWNVVIPPRVVLNFVYLHEHHQQKLG